MTYTEDFIAAEEGQALDAAAPTYPLHLALHSASSQ